MKYREALLLLAFSTSLGAHESTEQLLQKAHAENLRLQNELQQCVLRAQEKEDEHTKEKLYVAGIGLVVGVVGTIILASFIDEIQ